MADTTIWVISNRRDDRTVLWEQNVAHPGGEAFIGGAGPANVAKTPAIESLLRSGLIIEIPEPPDGPKKPIPVTANTGDFVLNQPGQPIQLGRAVDPDLLAGASAEKAVAKAQENAPDTIAVPSGVVIPPAESVKS